MDQRENGFLPLDRAFTKVRIEYAKKKDKKTQIQFIKDETIPRDDVYKSHTVHVPSGEPSTSTSRPRAKRKQGVVRPITQGKLLRAGGPSSVSGNCLKMTNCDVITGTKECIQASAHYSASTRKACV